MFFCRSNTTQQESQWGVWFGQNKYHERFIHGVLHFARATQTHWSSFSTFTTMPVPIGAKRTLTRANSLNRIHLKYIVQSRRQVPIPASHLPHASHPPARRHRHRQPSRLLHRARTRGPEASPPRYGSPGFCSFCAPAPFPARITIGDARSAVRKGPHVVRDLDSGGKPARGTGRRGSANRTLSIRRGKVRRGRRRKRQEGWAGLACGVGWVAGGLDLGGRAPLPSGWTKAQRAPSGVRRLGGARRPRCIYLQLVRRTPVHVPNSSVAHSQQYPTHSDTILPTDLTLRQMILNTTLTATPPPTSDLPSTPAVPAPAPRLCPDEAAQSPHTSRTSGPPVRPPRAHTLAGAVLPFSAALYGSAAGSNAPGQYRRRHGHDRARRRGGSQSSMGRG